MAGPKVFGDQPKWLVNASYRCLAVDESNRAYHDHGETNKDCAKRLSSAPQAVLVESFAYDAHNIK